MRRTLAAIVLGLALGAGVLGFAVDESSGAIRSVPASPTASDFPAAHDDGNTDNDEDVFLNENVINGQPTKICTRSTNPRLLQVLSQAIDIWHNRLSPDSDGDEEIDADALFDYHVFKRTTTPACAGADVEVVENTLLVNATSIDVECKGGVFDHAVSGSPRACYRWDPQSSPPRKLFKWDEAPNNSRLSDRAVLIYQALSHQPNSSDHLGTMVHELGHVLGLSHYDDPNHCGQLRQSMVDPLRDHFTAMSYRPRAGTTACETNGVITGRDLRDLYEAYHIGPLTDVRLDGDVTVTSSNQVKATFYWGEDGGEELSHNATHILAQRKTTSGWSTIGAAKAFDKDGKRTMMMTVRDCGGLAAEYRLVGSSAFRMGLNAFVDNDSLTSPMATRYSVWLPSCLPNLSAQALTQHPIGDPTHVTGVAAYDHPDKSGWCSSGTRCPAVLSAAISSAYCYSGQFFAINPRDASTPRAKLLYTASGGSKAPSVTPTAQACGATGGQTRKVNVRATWDTNTDATISISYQVLARPKRVKFEIAPSAAPGTCSPGDTVSIGWKLASDSGAPLTVFAYDRSATASPLVVSCPAGVKTGSSVEVWALRHDGGGRQDTASETQALTVSKVSNVRNCVAGEETTTNFDLSGGTGPYTYTDQLGVSRTKENPGRTWRFGYRCPASHGPSELTITVTDGVGRTVSAPVALNATCALPLQAPSVPFAQAGGIRSGAISLTWSEVCAESYRVRFTPADLDGRDTVETDRPPVAITRLQPNTMYRFTVQALAQGESSPASVASSMTTAPPPPQAEVKFDAWSGTPGGSYSVVVSWPAVAGAAEYGGDLTDVSPGSPIDAAVIGTAGDKDCAAPKSKRALRFCGLAAEGVYEIGVEARNSDGAASDPGKAIACLGPCALEVSQVTTSGFQLSWSALDPGGFAIYQIELALTADPSKPVKRYPSHLEGRYAFSGLRMEGEQEYRVRMRAYSNSRGGYSPWAATTFTTPKARLALSASLSPVNCELGQSAELSWQASGGTPPYTVTVAGQAATASPSQVECDPLGEQQVVVNVTDSSEPAQSVTQTLSFTVTPVPPPLKLTASVSPASCELGETTELTWAVTGGVKPYTVTIDGEEADASPAEVECDTVGEQQIVVGVTDSSAPTKRTQTQSLSLTVTPPPLVLTASLEPNTCQVGGTAQLSWEVSGGTSPYAVTVAGTAAAASPVAVDCDVVGAKQIAVTATDSSTPTAQTETQTLDLTVTALPALTLSAEASPTSCETGGEVTVSWTVGGGSGTHTVTVDGVERSGSETKLTCQAQAGTQTVTVKATDQAAGVSPVTKQLQLTVSKPAKQTVTATVRARRLSDDRVEFRLRLGDGTELTTAKRFLKLPEVTAGRWYASDVHTATFEGVDYTLGVVSARLDNTSCPALVQITFIPTGGERITPSKYLLPVDREADLWAVTSEFKLTLAEVPSTDALRQGGLVDSMTAAPAGADDRPGREGGLMLGDAAPADAQRAQSTKTCTDAPTSLVTSNITSGGARLSWGKVAGASEYDVAVGQGTSTELDSTQLAYDFTGLAADTEHTLRVRARSWKGASAWSSKAVRTKASALPVITIAAGASPVNEGASASFSVTSDRTLTTALDVKLSVTESGAMLSGTPATQVTIAKAAKSATVSVATADDEHDEDDSVVTVTLLSGTGYQLGAAKSAAVTVADDDGQDPQLSLTLTSSSNSCETGGQVTVGWTVAGGSGSYTVTVDGTSQSGASTAVTCQAAAGTQTVTVVATDQGDSTLTKTETLDLTVTTPPLTLTAKASPAGCETGGQVTVSWTVAGGSGAYTVTVDGVKQSGSSTKVTCQAAAGTQTVTVVATDKLHTTLTKTQQVKLTVTEPPGTVEAKLRARRLADNRFELGLRLADGTDVSVTKRFANPPSMTSGAWKQSEALSATIEGRSYSLGQISVRLENDRCPSRLELTFLSSGGSRISPAQRFLRTDAKLETWFSGAEFTISLSRSTSASARQSADDRPPAQNLLDDTPDATNAGPGAEGGSLSGETPSSALNIQAQADAQSSGTPVCPSPPSGLATGQITTNRIRLSWQAVTGASQYDLRRGSADIGFVKTNSYQFTGLSADTSYSLQVRTRDAWGASAWSSVTETTLPEVPDKPTNLGVTATKNSLTLSWDSASRATGYQVRINSGSGTPPNQPPRRHRFTGLSANTSYTLAVQATNRGGASGWAQITIKTKPAPVTLAASVSPTSCEPGESVTVTWTAGGGSGSYRVTVNGSARTGGSAKLPCQQTAGQQTITVTATDAAHADLSATVNLSVAVTAPPTVTGQVAARVLSSGKIEFAFRPQGGSRILPTSRIYTPDTTKLNRWTSSSEVRGRAGTESNRLFGKISIKHVKTTSSYYVDVCFRPAGASARICPSSNNFYYLGATANKWLYTDSFSFTPRRVSALSADSARPGSQDGQMEAATASEDQAAGTEGGLMSDQE